MLQLMERLEIEAAGSFSYEAAGGRHVLPLAPSEIPSALLLRMVVRTSEWVRVMHPEPMPWEATCAMRERWVAWAGLPEPAQARRLAYLLEHFHEQIEADFAGQYPGVDAIELWQQRRWRRLLNLVDRLPSGSWFSAATATDDDYVSMLIQAGVRPNEGPPPLHGWTPTVDMLARVVDQVKLVQSTIVASNAKKGSAPPPFTPTPRPVTAWDRAERKHQERQHRRVVGLFTPGRGSDDRSRG